MARFFYQGLDAGDPNYQRRKDFELDLYKQLAKTEKEYYDRALTFEAFVESLTSDLGDHLFHLLDLVCPDAGPDSLSARHSALHDIAEDFIAFYMPDLTAHAAKWAEKTPAEAKSAREAVHAFQWRIRAAAANAQYRLLNTADRSLVTLLESVLEKKKSSLPENRRHENYGFPEWASEHGLSRTLVHEWRKRVFSGMTLDGHVSARKARMIEQAILKDARSLGLLPQSAPSEPN